MALIDQKILDHMGIVDVGYTTEAQALSADHYNSWVDKKEHLPLTYLEGERKDKRQNLTLHYPEFQSALVFLFSYHTAHQDLSDFYQNNPESNGLKLASYTLGFSGDDYHEKIRDQLITLGETLKQSLPSLSYRLTLDTHPVLERDLAARAGLGWFGKNSMLINREHGSFFIIGSLLLNCELPEYQEKFKAKEAVHCGQCTKCIEACPTEAIDPITRTIIARDCISTFTIEQFKLDTIPSEKMTLKDGFIFGCDICQDVCPWNKRVDRLQFGPGLLFETEKSKMIIDTFLKQKPAELTESLESLTEGQFKRQFKNTSFERSGRRGLLKNLLFYQR